MSVIRVRFKDKALLFKWAHLKMAISNCRNVMTIQELCAAESANHIMQLRMVLYRLNKRLNEKTI